MTSVDQLLSQVEKQFGAAKTIDLLRDLGAHPTKLDSGEPPDTGSINTNTRIIVIGAGVAGLTLTYELEKKGANVELWEATAKVGGRNRSVRNGEELEEIGHPNQVCNLPSQEYLNAGPGRISHHHRAVMHYCKQFSLTLKPYQTLNRAALLHRHIPELKRDIIVRNRQVQFDGQGRIGEIAAKVGPWFKTNGPINEELEDALRDWLHDNFEVDQDRNGEWKYHPSGRSGYSIGRGGAKDHGMQEKPITLEQILGLRLWYDDPRRSPDVIDEQLSMFELEGGNDGLVRALAKKIKHKLKLNRKLKKLIRNHDGTVILEGIDNEKGEIRVVADRVILAMQPQAMTDMELDLPEPTKEALRDLPGRYAVKVAGWMKRRFWEDDLAIYGGITFTNMPNQQIWYPNSGFHDQKGGLLVLAYAALHHGKMLGELPPSERCKATVELSKRIHPQITEEIDLNSLITIAWQNVPYIRSPWVAWTPDRYQRWFKEITKPMGSVAFAGDWCSHLPAWQEGAIRSAYSLLEWAGQ